MSHRTHTNRLLILIAAVVAGFVVVRMLVIPESFGLYGYYRGDNLKEQMNMPLVHLESAFCRDCHREQFKDWQNHTHRTVNCEVCHGHWEIHNGNLKTMAAMSHNDACMLCHQSLTGRPESISQIKSFDLHLAELEESGTDKQTCVQCHNPHAPQATL